MLTFLATHQARLKSVHKHKSYDFIHLDLGDETIHVVIKEITHVL